jgi:flagellar P-ring protein precursor FlgI
MTKTPQPASDETSAHQRSEARPALPRRWLGVNALALPILMSWVASTFGGELSSISRIKGQESVKLHGLGLVAGLSGTGDARFDPKDVAAVQLLRSHGIDILNLREVSAAKNLALVSITCEISPHGGRDGDRFDCQVASVGSARSLRGGRLLQAALKSPVLADQTAYAIAEGPLSSEDPAGLLTARIKAGATLVQDLPAPMLKCNDRVTVVLDEAHASFSTAGTVTSAINGRFDLQTGGRPIARMLDARSIEVLLPGFARRDPGPFLADLMRTRIGVDAIHTDARIVINEKQGTIVITGEVELKPVMVAHRNMVVYPANQPLPFGAVPPNPFVPLAKAPPANGQALPSLTALQDLLEAMNRAQVSADDRIAIVKELARSGKLHASVIYE